LVKYERHVKPAFDYTIAPSMIHADIIVPHGGVSEVAINLVTIFRKTILDAVKMQKIHYRKTCRVKQLFKTLLLVTTKNWVFAMKKQNDPFQVEMRILIIFSCLKPISFYHLNTDSDEVFSFTLFCYYL
jgi:hypothetical protein